MSPTGTFSAYLYCWSRAHEYLPVISELFLTLFRNWHCAVLVCHFKEWAEVSRWPSLKVETWIIEHVWESQSLVWAVISPVLRLYIVPFLCFNGLYTMDLIDKKYTLTHITNAFNLNWSHGCCVIKMWWWLKEFLTSCCDKSLCNRPLLCLWSLFFNSPGVTRGPLEFSRKPSHSHSGNDFWRSWEYSQRSSSEHFKWGFSGKFS